MSQSRICAEEGFAQVQRLEAKDLRLSWNWLKLGLGLAVELKRAQARGSQLNCNGLMPKARIPKVGLVEQTRAAQNYSGFGVVLVFFCSFMSIKAQMIMSSNAMTLSRAHTINMGSLILPWLKFSELAKLNKNQS